MKYFIRDGEISYSMKIKNNIIYLFFSKFGNWTDKVKGKQAAKMVNTGNGYEVTLEDKKLNLDYCQAEELLLLLKEAEKDVKMDILHVVRDNK